MGRARATIVAVIVCSGFFGAPASGQGVPTGKLAQMRGTLHCRDQQGISFDIEFDASKLLVSMTYQGVKREFVDGKIDVGSLTSNNHHVYIMGSAPTFEYNVYNVNSGNIFLYSLPKGSLNLASERFSGIGFNPGKPTNDPNYVTNAQCSSEQIKSQIESDYKAWVSWQNANYGDKTGEKFCRPQMTHIRLTHTTSRSI
jgi:hypothetical protein